MLIYNGDADACVPITDKCVMQPAGRRRRGSRVPARLELARPRCDLDYLPTTRPDLPALASTRPRPSPRSYWWTQSMNYSTVTPWAPYYNDDGSMGGYVTQYNYNFTFATIRLAGHMVPQTQPITAYKLAYTHITGGSWSEETK